MAKYRATAVIEYDVPDDYEPSEQVSLEPRGLAYGFDEIEGNDAQVIEILGEATDAE